MNTRLTCMVKISLIPSPIQISIACSTKKHNPDLLFARGESLARSRLYSNLAVLHMHAYLHGSPMYVQCRISANLVYLFLLCHS